MERQLALHRPMAAAVKVKKKIKKNFCSETKCLCSNNGWVKRKYRPHSKSWRDTTFTSQEDE